VLPAIEWHSLELKLFPVVYVDKAIELTEEGKGKHHIGDFLPPEEMEKFLEKVQAIKEGRDPGQ